MLQQKCPLFNECAIMINQMLDVCIQCHRGQRLVSYSSTYLASGLVDKTRERGKPINQVTALPTHPSTPTYLVHVAKDKSVKG